MLRAATSFVFVLLCSAQTPETRPAADVAELQAQLARDPRNIEARMLLADAFAARRDYPRVIQELQRVVSFDPRNLPAYLHLTMALLDWNHDPEEAELLLLQGLENFPAHPSLLSLLANVHTIQAGHHIESRQWNAAASKIEAARSGYQRAISGTPQNASRAAAYLGLGSALQLESELARWQNRPVDANKAAEGAGEAYRTALTLDPGLREQVRALEIELALPNPRFPRTYSRTHLSVSLENRLRRIREQLAARSHN